MAAKKKTSKKTQKKSRPKNIWHSVTKLETFLKKAQIQSSIFMNALYELRDTLSFEIRCDLVKSLCHSVNGDILYAIWEYIRRLDEGKFLSNIEENSIIRGMYDTLTAILKMQPYRFPGEMVTIRKDAAKEFTFEEAPESLCDETADRLSFEILRPGWKVDDKIVVKPVAFESNSKSLLINSDMLIEQKVAE